MTQNPKDGKKKFVVAWDFPKKPSSSFYRMIAEELGTAHPGGDYHMIQRSVAVCRDDFIASRLAALAEYFGATVASFMVEREGFDHETQNEARAFLDRALQQRLHRRGRHPVKARRQ